MPVILLANSAAGQEITGLDLFQLWNDCDPVFLAVESLNDSAEKAGLTKQRIQTMAKSGLRAARIYSHPCVGNKTEMRSRQSD